MLSHRSEMVHCLKEHWLIAAFDLRHVSTGNHSSPF
jgi:hypothetical protein